MGEFRLVFLICSLLMVACVIRLEHQPQTTTGSHLPFNKVHVSSEVVPATPTPSKIINNLPLIGVVGKPKYSEQFKNEFEWCELWYSVTFQTSASFEEFDKQLSEYFETHAYELNPDQGHWESKKSLPPGECRFSYWNEGGKNFVIINHLRYFEPGGISLEEAIETF